MYFLFFCFKITIYVINTKLTIVVFLFFFLLLLFLLLNLSFLIIVLNYIWYAMLCCISIWGMIFNIKCEYLRSYRLIWKKSGSEKKKVSFSKIELAHIVCMPPAQTTTPKSPKGRNFFFSIIHTFSYKNIRGNDHSYMYVSNPHKLCIILLSFTSNTMLWYLIVY